METPPRWPRWLLIAAGFLILLLFASSWLAGSSRVVEAFGPVDDAFVVSDAGPVRIRSWSTVDETVLAELGDAAEGSDLERDVVVRATTSALVRRPQLESLREGGGLVFRSTCDTRLPCRSALEVFVPDGMELTVVATSDMVQVDSFEGALLVFAGDAGVALGSVAGSVSVVSGGPVQGSTLGPAELTVEVVDASVQLTYLDVPEVLAVSAGSGPVTIELPSEAAYAADIRADDVAVSVDVDDQSERLVSVDTEGRVIIEPTLTN